MLRMTLQTNDYQLLSEHQRVLERKALKLAAAWSDFDSVETISGEIIRRFGSIDPRDLGVIRLHKHPLFVALQTAAVTHYVRPFIEDGGIGQVEPKYGTYNNIEWNRMHSELFVWQHRLTGECHAPSRQFMVAPDEVRNPTSGRFVIGEASDVLEPLRRFTLIRAMCGDRKELLWPDLQEAIAACYPFLKHPVLLSLKDS